MTPSSRTPEGDHVHCDVYGTDSDIEASRPPGDVPCPVCGSLVWTALPTDGEITAEEIASTRRRISDLFGELQRHVEAPGATRNEITRQLVRILTACLAARGTTIWSHSRGWKIFGGGRLRIECSCGTVDTSNTFASAVADSMEPTALLTQLGGESVLLLGVPLVRDGRLLAVVEVVQRPTTKEATQRGYVRFIEQASQMAAHAEAFAG